jgi:eukaryotic-like serine/threonine-protein kinase
MHDEYEFAGPDLPDNPGVSLKPHPTSPDPLQSALSRTPKLNEVSISFSDTTPRSGDSFTSVGSIQASEIIETFDARTMYILKQKVGQGGFGEVWEALQVSLGRTVAVKRPHAAGHVMENPTATVEQVFTKEAYTAARLDHPNIIPIYDLGMGPDRRPLLAMKYVEGIPWDDSLKEDRLIPLQARLTKHLPILVNVAQAVAFAHSRGVVHRDLKPSQVMVGRFGEVYLMDWGLAVSLVPENEQHIPIATPVRNAVNPAGTVAFMAPEQTEKTCENIGTWTDVYLLGAILYLILTNTTPHHQSNARAAFRHAQLELLDPPEERCPGTRMPADLSRLCMRAMAREVGDRIQTASDFVTELNSYITGSGRWIRKTEMPVN